MIEKPPIAVATGLFTVTETFAEVPTFEEESYAFEESVCVPLATVVVSKIHSYGAVVSVDFNTPPSRNSTLVTATLSVALAVTVVVPTSVAPAAGAVIAVVGAVRSLLTVTPTAAEALLLPAASKARELIEWEPLVDVCVFHDHSYGAVVSVD